MCWLGKDAALRGGIRMMNAHSRPSMFEWLFKPDTVADKVVHLGVAGVVLAAIVKDAVVQVTPSVGMACLICLAIALLLALPILGKKAVNEDSSLRSAILALAIAFLGTAILYFLSWTKVWDLPKGYHAATDVISTLFYVAAWYILSAREPDEQTKTADRFALTILCIGLLVAGVTKLVLDQPLVNLPKTETYRFLFEQGSEARLILNAEAARLVLNLCNGAIFLSLYGQLRRLYTSPDPITHVFILLFGCAQIAAHGRDCLSAATPCAPPTVEAIAALSIAWILLLGKIAFALYLSYLYFNGTPEKLEDAKVPGVS